MVTFNTSFISEEAVNQLPQNFNTPKKDLRAEEIKSPLFFDKRGNKKILDPDIKRIANGYLELGLETKIDGPYVVKIGLALKIVLQRVDFASVNLVSNFKPEKRFTTELYQMIRQFQIVRNLPVDGIIGAETLMAIEKELQDIKYYDLDREGIVRDRKYSRHISRYIYTVVKNGGCHLYNKAPVTVNTKGEELDIDIHIPHLNFNQNILIYEIIDTSDGLGSYCFVAVNIDDDIPNNIRQRFDAKNPEDLIELSKEEEEQGIVYGYIKTNDLWTYSRMPDPKAKLFNILSLLKTVNGQKQVPTITEIVEHLYSINSSDSNYNEKLLFYAKMILFANNLRATNESYLPIDQMIYKELNRITGTYGDIGYSDEQKLENRSYQHLAYAPIYTTKNWSYKWKLAITGGSNGYILPDFTTNWEDYLKQLLKVGTDYIEVGDIIINQNLLDENEIHTVGEMNNYLWIPSRIFTEGVEKTSKNILMNPITNVRNTLSKWKIGRGIAIHGEIDVSFRKFLEIDTEGQLYFYRDSENSFTLVRRGIFGIGAAIGNGWASFKEGATGLGSLFGTNRRKREEDVNITGNTKNEKVKGRYLEAGFQVELGIRLLCQQTFQFNFNEDRAIANIIFMILGGDILQTALKANLLTFGVAFFTNLEAFGLSPEAYLVTEKTQIQGYGSGAAGVDMGKFKFGTNQPLTKWDKSQDPVIKHSEGSEFLIKHLNRFLEKSLFASFEVTVATGVKYNFSDKKEVKRQVKLFPWSTPEEVIFLSPTKVEIEIYREFSAFVQASTNIPCVGFFINWLNAFNGLVPISGGVKTVYEIDLENNPHKANLKKVGFYSSSGDVDIPLVNSAEYVCYFDLPIEEHTNTLFEIEYDKPKAWSALNQDEIENLVHSITIDLQLGQDISFLGHDNSRSMRNNLQKRKMGLDVLTKVQEKFKLSEHLVAGGGIFTMIRSEANKEAATRIFLSVKDIVGEINGVLDILTLYWGVIRYLATGNINEIQRAADKVIGTPNKFDVNEFKASLQEGLVVENVKLHGTIGLALVGAISEKKAKVGKLFLMGGRYWTYEYKLSSDEIESLFEVNGEELNPENYTYPRLIELFGTVKKEILSYYGLQE